jgi:acylphosphatase
LAGRQAGPVTRKYLISGRVQGVGFRYFVLRQATGLGLAGWIRNLPNGSVEVVARGDELALSGLEAALERGPSHSEVKNVDKSLISDDIADVNGFEIR